MSTIDAVGNLHDAAGQFAGRVRGEADADNLLEEPGVDEAREPVRYAIPSWGVEAATARIDKANRRLARAGVEERFEPLWGETRLVTYTDAEGREHSVEYIDLELNHPRLSCEGWTFAAALDQTEAGMIVRTAPDVDLAGYRPEESWCDHCGTRRQRATTYLVQHEDGTTMQVGSTCMQDFLGVEPKGLWSIGSDPLEGAEDEWGRGGGGFSSAASLEDTRMVVAAALVASNMGRDYRPSSFDNSTPDEVRDILWGTGGSREQRAARAAAYEKAKALVDGGTVDEVVAAAAAMEGNSDYAENMRTLMGAEHTRSKHVGFVASSVKAWAKDAEKRVRESRPKAQGWIAPAGAKLNTLTMTADGSKGVDATVEKAITLESFYGYHPSYSTLLIMRTADGHTVKWKASSLVDLDPGDQIRLTGGSVKEQSTYEGTDQTVITRAKFDVLSGRHAGK